MDQGVGCIFRCHVLNDEDGCGKITRQLTDEIIQSVQTARGSTDDDDVTSFISHKALLSANCRSAHCTWQAAKLFDADLPVPASDYSMTITWQIEIIQN
jgi:hypothetical protein